MLVFTKITQTVMLTFLIIKSNSYHNTFHPKYKYVSALYSTKVSKSSDSDFRNIGNNSTNSNSLPNKLQLPFLDIESLGLKGNWYEKSGNFLLKPPNKPLGVIHFLGGAFVGAAPHLTYKYLLETLADSGYIIVATPYRLNMDYVKICDEILTKFDGVAYDLASEYGGMVFNFYFILFVF